MDDNFELTRRKALAALGSIGVASAGAGLGTSAYFSDQETFENNQLTAGTLDMKVGWSEHYSDWSDDEGDGVSVRMYDGDGTGGSGDLESGESGLPADDAWLIAVDDPEQFLTNTEEEAVDISDAPCEGLDVPEDLPMVGDDRPVIQLGDVKPGDFGEVTFDFALCDNPGYVWLNGSLVDADENGRTEPEADDPDEEAGIVELLDEVRAAVWVDDGNNYQNGDESPLLVDSLRNVLAALNNGTGVELSGDIDAEEGGGTGRNCFAGTADGETTLHSVVFAWWLPVDHANEIQSDSVTFDLGFYTEQCRHNDGVGLSTDLTAYYPLDANADDVSGNGYDGTITGDVSFTSGQVGQAASFDGGRITVAYDDNDVFDAQTDISVSAWVYLTANGSGYNGIVGSHQNNSPYHGWAVAENPSGNLGLWSDASGWSNTSQALPLGAWTHLAITRSASDATATVYVDGAEATTATWQAPSDNDRPLFIGDRADGEGPPFNGHIDDVRIYSRALSASEVQALYDSA